MAAGSAALAAFEASGGGGCGGAFLGVDGGCFTAVGGACAGLVLAATDTAASSNCGFAERVFVGDGVAVAGEAMLARNSAVSVPPGVLVVLLGVLVVVTRATVAAGVLEVVAVLPGVLVVDARAGVLEDVAAAVAA